MRRSLPRRADSAAPAPFSSQDLAENEHADLAAEAVIESGASLDGDDRAEVLYECQQVRKGQGPGQFVLQLLHTAALRDVRWGSR